MTGTAAPPPFLDEFPDWLARAVDALGLAVAHCAGGWDYTLVPRSFVPRLVFAASNTWPELEWSTAEYCDLTGEPEPPYAVAHVAVVARNLEPADPADPADA